MKKILITGTHSYIGTSFVHYLKQWPEDYQVDTISLRGEDWKLRSFSGYDVVYHLAGIAHSDSGRISQERINAYYHVNTDLTIAAAKKAKADGVKQFIFMSSSIVYGESSRIGERKIITRDTPVAPANSYGDSKVQAENGILPLQDENFRVVIIRAPMIYGKDCKGNYPIMSQIARTFPFFPYVENRRSMLYIENLLEFVRLMIENEEQGIFWPQNSEYSNTSEMVKMIAALHGRDLPVKGFGWALQLLSHVTGIVNKAFGGMCYDQEMSVYKQDYCKVGLVESIRRSEFTVNTSGTRKILVFSQYFFPENFRINQLCQELVRRGNDVTVLTAYPQYPIGRIYDGYGFNVPYEKEWNGVHIERVKVHPRGKTLFGMLRNCVDYVVAANHWVDKCTEQYDAVYVCQLSPVTVGLPAATYKKKFGVPIIYNLQDLWPESVEEVLGIRFKPAIFVINRIVDYIYGACDRILCTSSGFVENLKARGVDSKKLYFWPQFCPEPKLETVTKPECYTEDTFNIVFAGNLGDAQGLDLMVESAKKLKGSGIRWYLLGDGRAREHLERLVRDYGVQDDVIFLGRVSTDEADRYVHFADCAYLSFMENKLLNITLPAKLQTYLACGTPILAAAGGESAQIISRNGCGVVCRAERNELVAAALKAASLTVAERETMSRAARAYYEDHFTMDRLVDQLEEMIDEEVKKQER